MTSDEISVAIDNLKSLDCDNSLMGYDVLGEFMNERENGSYSAIDLRDRLIDLLEMADPDTHMELPKDADGEPIHEGDTVYDVDTCQRMVVRDVCVSAVCAYVRFTDNGECIDEVGLVNLTPQALMHHKPTAEDVLNAFYVDCEDAGGSSSAVRQLAIEYAEKLRELVRDE